MEQWNLEPAHDLGLPLGKRIRSVRRERGLIPWGIHLVSWAILGMVLRLYHRLKIEGRGLLPAEGPFILAANHASHLDAMVLGCALPRRLRPDAFPIAAGDTFFKTTMAAAASALFVNALPMSRRGGVKHSLDDLRDRLTDEGCIYIIFPEGTRTRDGTIGRFKSGLGMIVAGTGVPVIPCRLRGTFEALPAGRRWPRPRKIWLTIGAPMRFDAVTNDRDGWDEIAKQLEGAIKGSINDHSPSPKSLG